MLAMFFTFIFVIYRWFPDFARRVWHESRPTRISLGWSSGSRRSGARARTLLWPLVYTTTCLWCDGTSLVWSNTSIVSFTCLFEYLGKHVIWQKHGANAIMLAGYMEETGFSVENWKKLFNAHNIRFFVCMLIEHKMPTNSIVQ